MSKSINVSLRMAAIAAIALAAAGAGHASPSTVTYQGLSLKGPCPGALVWVGSKIFVSTRVTATNSGGCRYDDIHETSNAGLADELTRPRPEQVLIQGIGNPSYQTFMRTAARLQDLSVYRLILSNGAAPT